jgi:hypothetical protein
MHTLEIADLDSTAVRLVKKARTEAALEERSHPAANITQHVAEYVKGDRSLIVEAAVKTATGRLVFLAWYTHLDATPYRTRTTRRFAAVDGKVTPLRRAHATLAAAA